MRREWIEIYYEYGDNKKDSSPSMRREWIEMQSLVVVLELQCVSLHAEGVD